MRSPHVFVFLLVPLFMAACADSDLMRDGESPGDGGDGDWVCHSDGDCPSGLVCREQTCVSADDGRPPEEQFGHVFMKPEASPRFIYALSPHTDTLAIIDAVDLAIDTLPMAAEPHDLAVLPGRDAVAIVSREGRTLTVLEEDAGWRMWRLDLDRRYPAISVCPEGRWAVLWTPDGIPPDTGAEGIVSIVDLQAVLEGGAPVPLERAAGRRHTTVYFRQTAGRTTEAVIVGNEEIAVVEIDDLDRPVPRRIPLPDAFTDNHSRQVVVSDGGDYALLRSFVAPELAIFHTATRELVLAPLPAVATDLALATVPADLGPPRQRGVIALRSVEQVGHFDLAALVGDPGNPDRVEIVDVEGVLPGQIALSPNGRFAAVFTNSEPSSSLAWLDFATGELQVFDRLQKWVRTVGIGPDGRTAIVLHRPDPDSTLADPYERAVARDEGYSLVDLEDHFAQLKRTGGIPPREFVFSADGAHAGVVLSDGDRVHHLDAIDLTTLVTHTFDLASAPRFSGALPADPQAGGDRVWVTQSHPAGRISFVSLARRTLRTVTGYDLNAEIE